MDPRLADRRQRVAEDRARSNLGRLLRFLMIVAGLAAVIWLLQSPFLSVTRLHVRGASQVDVMAILNRAEIVEGRPMLLLDIEAAEGALTDEPWVKEAGVARDWPTTVVVEIVERRPAAVLQASDGPHLIAEDGVVLEPAPEPPPAHPLPVAVFPSVSSEEATDSREVMGAVVFLAALPPDRKEGARVGRGEDGLEARVSGYRVRLGGPFDMEDKALVTAELLATGVEEGSVVTVVAPASPAILAPGAAPSSGRDQADGDGTGEGEATDTTRP